MKKYNWAILGTGNIGREMATALNEVNGEIYAVCNPNVEKLKAFADKFHIANIYNDYDEMIKDPKIDIVYIATPHNLHYEYILKSIKNGKHVFCEKAITVNAKQLDEVVVIAKEKNLVIVEGMTMFHMPLYKKLREIVKSGAIGKVKMVQVNFGSCKEYDVNNRFFSKELAGGALLDIGVYATSFARYFMESKPNVILTTAKYFETGVDEQSGIIMKNDCDQMAVMALTMRAKQPKRGVVAGELGYIEVNNYPRADKATIFYSEDGRTEELNLGETAKALNYEVTDMQEYITNNTGDDQLALTVDVTHLLSEIRNQWGFVYPFE
ncbi:Gfo/Idh/MocA family oxidoreductase [Clostridium estertheticum]|uniref:Gfo/Idh/MocA family oxidoreductase n=1 Tax=Clostridium estertheticum TaxID=238834 RepID=A0AA47I8W4_9CLOT|nr:Gfo/Idh/MocA family oxidoreductase [Clostridium estertheticum]MBU3157232.1 Gfo/Idh/MocA family oxidoreductase [Clostridium estertheticum]MBU3175259.1 Gfo/Idh/MocA family oxidoreductase [Clostridium estertheticum]MBU3200886.1 Gfo/Idh/MocA family oxidoreductase [Clostridium estertheticum]WAG61869.1 Gfo/Idh/MocA family oxidoreductase [Clostridium estertheticum]WAG64012.1 Gfo/Idh/MocA family oxidoreductase [Clostridium estertheticum]